VTTVITFYWDYAAGTASHYQNVPSVKAMGEQKSHIDFSFHLLITAWDQLTNIHKYFTDYAISSFKFIMAYKGEEAKSVGMVGNETDDGFLLEAFSILAKLPRAVACVHAENIEIIIRLIKKYREEGRDGLPVWPNAAQILPKQKTFPGPSPLLKQSAVPSISSTFPPKRPWRSPGILKLHIQKYISKPARIT